MVTGSVAGMLYGKPRMTNDMDVVVALERKSAERLLGRFSTGEFYIPPVEAVQAEILRRGQFNLIHSASGAKVDFVIQKNTEFAIEEFSRRITIPFSNDTNACSATPEDVILSKLMYFQIGESEKHLRDIRGIIAVSRADLDLEYLDGWVRRLGLDKQWAMCQSR